MIRFHSKIIIPNDNYNFTRDNLCTRVLEGHMSNTGDIFQCLASKKYRKIVAFSKQFKILNKLFIHFIFQSWSHEWVKKKKTRYNLHTTSISHVCMCTTSIRCWDSCLYLYIPGGTTNRLMLWSTMIYPARIKKHTCNSFFALKYQLPSCCPLKKVKGKLYTLKIYFDDIDTTT